MIYLMQKVKRMSQYDTDASRMSLLRDRSLITGRGYKIVGGGQVKFYPYKKEGVGTSFSHAERGQNGCGEVFYAVVLTILKGGGQEKFPPFKSVGAKSFTLS